ncbi:MAG: cobalt-precorrin-6A reductase [Alphaproteobacteria bacterium]|nr:cobalt-precorrin-6A reductase [Alphaproteobacteria bacterium]
MADRVLILGGTAEARELAAALVSAGAFEPVTALAGRTDTPAEIAGTVRVGGFGGVDGLIEHLRAERYTALIDATHPFARQISEHAARAAALTGVPRLALVRPPWRAGAGDRWIAAADERAAAEAVRDLDLGDATVFLALGRQRVQDFAAIGGRFLLRTVEPMPPPFESFRMTAGRGPFHRADEQALFEAEGVVVLVCRNSGGASGRATLDAARDLGLPVVMIDRPEPPEPPCVETVAEAFGWLRRRRTVSA